MMDRQSAMGYIAPKPKPILSEILGGIFYWSLPPTALWNISSYVANSFAGEKLGKRVLPAQDNPELKEEAAELRASFFRRSGYVSANLERLSVQTYDNAILDTFEITPKNNVDRANDRTHVIYFNGNAGCYERGIIHMLDNAIELNVNVIGFNYRGVADSIGRASSKDDLIIDGIAQVQRLLDRGVDPQKIVLRGNSLGGAIAALVCKHFHDRGQKISIFSIRSFSTLSNAYVGWVRTGFPEDYHETMYRKMLGWLAKPFIMFVFALCNWELDGYSAYKAIPEEYKEYLTVRSSKEKRKLERKDDTVISHYASLHLALKPERRVIKQQLQTAKDELLAVSNCCHLMKADLTSSLMKIDDAKKRLQERKMEAMADDIEGHNVHLHELTNRYGQTGHRFFQQFVNRVHDRNSTPAAMMAARI